MRPFLIKINPGFIAVAAMVFMALLFFIAPINAAPNQQINYQGKLTDAAGVAVADGTYNMWFYLYNTTGGATTTNIWEEQWLVGSSNGVQVTNGLFSVMLGSTTPLTGVDFNQTLYLGVEIGDTTGSPAWDGEMSPRKVLGTVPAAFEAQQLDGLATTSFLRADQADTMEATSATTLLTLIQNGAGAIFQAINSSAENVFSIFDSGIVTVGTSTDANIATSTGLAVYNKDVEILPGDPVLVGSFDDGGAGYGIEVSGDYAYVADQSGDFEIFDISDPTNPVKLSNPSVGSGNAYGVAVKGNYAYLADGNDGLEIYDISDPTAPTTTGSYDVGGTNNAYEVAVHGGYAYLANGADGLQIIDVQDPTNPTLTGTADTDSLATAIDVVGSYAYVADWTDGIDIIDISDPTSPIIVGELDTDTGSIYGIEVSGSYAYTVDSAEGLEIIDVSDPTSPVEVGSLAGGALGITIAGNYAYVSDGLEGLLIVDVSSSTNPVSVGSIDTANAYNTAIVGNYVYLADGGGGLVILDLGGLITPTAEIGNLLVNDIESDFVRVTQSLTTDSLNVGTNALIGGALTITGTASSSLQAGNTNAALTVMTGNVGIGTTSPYANLSVDGDFALTGGLFDNNAFIGTTGMLLQSTGSGVQWVATSSLGLGSGSGGLFTDGGDITYLTDSDDVLAIGTSTDIATSTGLAVYNKDVEILAGSPVAVGSVNDGAAGATVLDRPESIVVKDNYAYIASYNDDGVQILDISDPTNPVGVGSVTDGNNGANTLNGARVIAISGHYAYVASDLENGVQVLDISDPTNPIGVGSIADGTNGAEELAGARSIAIDGNYAYVAGYSDAGVQVLDISDPTNPIGVGSIADGANGADELNQPRDIVIRGNFAYIPSFGDDGFQILDISDPTNPIGVGSVTDGANNANTLNGARSVVLSGRYAYVTGAADNGVQVLDISDPTNPVGVGSIIDGANGATVLSAAYGIAMVGKNLYVTSDSENGIQVLDISSSTAPVGVGSIIDGSAGAEELLGAYNIAINGNYAYVIGRDDDGLQILDLGGLITPTAEIGNLLANDIQSDFVRVTQNLTTDGALNVGTNALIGGSLTITGTASSSLQAGNTNPALVITSGYVGIGTTTPYADLAIDGNLALTGGLYDGSASLGTSGQVLQTSGSATTWVSTSSLNLAPVLFTDGGDITYLTDLTDEVLAIGTSTDVATSTGLAVYNRDIEILPGDPIEIGSFSDGATTRGVTVKGDYLYVADGGGGFEIVDVSDPTSPVELSDLFDGGSARESIVVGNYAYVADDDDGLEIIDISDPTNPIEVGQFDDGVGSVSSLAVYGNYAYLADATDSLEIIDISDPTNPFKVGGFDDGGFTYGVEVRGNYAYMVDGNEGLEIIDISDPANTFEVGTVGNGGVNLYISGNYVYLVGADGLDIIDVSDPTTPVEVGNYSNGSGEGNDVEVVGNYAYVADGSDGIEIIDISSSTNPVRVASFYDGGGGANEIAISGNYAYVADGLDAVEILDLGGLITPTAEIGNLLANDIATDYLRVTQSLMADGGLNVGTNAMIGGTLTVVGNASSSLQGQPDVPALAVTSGNVVIGSVPTSTGDIATSTGLAVYNKDVEILPGDPVKVGGAEATDIANDVTVVGHYAYLATEATSEELQIFDISDPTSPTKIGAAGADDDAKAVAVAGNYAYVVSQVTGDDLEVFDISDPTSPAKIGEIDLAVVVYGLKIVGNYAYLVGEDGSPGGELYILDISNPETPVILSTVDTASDAYSVDVAGNYAFVGSSGGTDDFEIFDVSNPANPFKVGGNDNDEGPFPSLNITSGVEVRDHYAYTTAYVGVVGGSMFEIFDVSDPSNPIGVGLATTSASYFYDVTILGNYAYVTSDATVKVFDISSSTNPVEVGGADATATAFGVTVAGNYAYVVSASTGDDLEIFDLGGLITPTAEIGNLLANDIESDYLRVSQSLTTDGALNVGTNALIQGALTITGTASSSLQSGNTNPALVITSGYVGIGTTTPYADLAIDGNLALTGGLYDSTASLGTSGQILQTTGSVTTWVSTSSLNITPSLFTDGGDITYLTDLTDEVLAIGTSTDVATSTGLAVYNRDVEILVGTGTPMWGVGSITDGAGSPELNGARYLTIAGNYAYVTGFNDNGVQVLDISDPTNPTGVGSINDGTNGADELSGARGIVVSGNYAYVTGFNGDGVQVLDISDPTNPTGVGSINDGTNGADLLDGARSIAIAGNYAYVTGWYEAGVQILDISDPTNPVGVGSIVDETNGADTLNGPRDIAIAGNYAYVAAATDNGVQVLDISDPTNPVGVGSITDGAGGADELLGAYGIAIAGNYAYVGGSDDNGVQVLDISDPTSPVGVGSITDGSNGADTLQGAQYIAIAGNYAYVTSDTDSGVQVLDISSSTNPVGVGSITDGNNGADTLAGANDIVIVGNYAYVTGYDDSGVQVLDLGGLITPTAEIGNLLANDIQSDYLRVTQSLMADGLNVGTNAMIGGTLTVVGNASSSLQGDTTQPALAVTSGNVVIGSVPTTTDIATSTGLAVYNKDVEILAGDPTLIADYYTGTAAMSFPQAFDIAGDYAYVVGGNAQDLIVVDISDPNAPVAVGNYDPGASTMDNPRGVKVAGNYAYINGYDSDNLVIVDISDPTNPTGVSVWDPGDTSIMDSPRSVDVQGNYAYMSGGGLSDNLAIIDISDPTNPFLAGNWDPGDTGIMDNAHTVTVRGNYAYMTGNGTAPNFVIIDVSDPTNPTLVYELASGAFGDLQQVKVSGKYAYIPDYDNDNFYTIDISDPTNPTIEDTLSSPYDGGTAVTVAGNYAFFAHFTDDAISIADISSSTNAVTVGSVVPGAATMDQPRDIIVRGNYLYAVAEGTDNLLVFDLGGLITPTAEIGNLLANDIETDYLRVTQSLTTDGALNVGTNALIGGALTITGTASSSLQGTNTNPALVITSGYVGIGTTSPYADLSIDGDLALTGGIYDSTASLGSNGDILFSTGSGIAWTATSSLGGKFTDGGDISYLTSLTDVLAIGTSTDISTSTGLAVYNRDVEILAGEPELLSQVGQNAVIDVEVVGDYAYTVSNASAGVVSSYDISDPTNPVLIDFITPGSPILSDAYTIDVKGNYAYVTGDGNGPSNGDLVIIDISNPSDLSVAGNWGSSVTQDTRFATVVGDYAYVSGFDTNNMAIVDISDPTNPFLAGEWDPNNTAIMEKAFPIAVVGNYAYVGAAQPGLGELAVVDVSDPTNPTFVASYDPGGATIDRIFEIAVSGKHAYILGFDNAGTPVGRMVIVDISDPNNITTLSTFAPGNTILGGPSRIKIVGNYAYIGAGAGTPVDSDNVVVIDISSSTNPTLVANWDPGTGVLDNPRGLDVKGNYLYVAGDASDDLSILKLPGVVSPTAEIGNLVSNDIETNFLRVTQALVADSLNVNTNGMIGGALTITGTASSSLISSNSLTALNITSGFIKIGTSTSNATSGIQIGYGAICVDNDGECSATTTGRISSVSTYSGNSDLAESYFSADALEAGDIVELEGELSVTKAVSTSTNTIIGVVSTKPGVLLGFDDVSTKEGESQYPIALKGRIPVKVSTENGPVSAGDQLMLSNIPGTAMKATGTGAVIGIALEDFAPEEDDQYYSETYINQYIDDLPSTESATSVIATLEEKEVITETVKATSTEALTDNKPSNDTAEVQVGQIIMFVDLSYRYVDENTTAALETLMEPATEEHQGDDEAETIMSRLVTLANNFVDGVLRVFTLEARRVDLMEELCVDGTCINETDLQILIDSANDTTEITVIDDEGSGDVSVQVTDPTPTISTTTQTSGTTTNPVENGGNTATSSQPIGDNVETTNGSTEGGDVVSDGNTETPENAETEPQNGNVENSNTDNAETPSEDVAGDAPEAPASGNSEESAPAPESVPEPEVVVEEPTTQSEEESSDSGAGNVINEEA